MHLPRLLVPALIAQHSDQVEHTTQCGWIFCAGYPTDSLKMEGPYLIFVRPSAQLADLVTPDGQQELSLTVLELLVNIVLVEIRSKGLKKGDGRCTMLLLGI